MVEGQDLEVLKDIPGYKAILRALIKSQMQHLVEQLATHTEEECVLLSASLSDGSLSHLGSDYGKQFLDDFDDVKKQFLSFCLKKQLKRPVTNTETVRSNEGPPTSFTQATMFTQASSNNRRNRPNHVMSVRQRPSTSPYSRFRPHKQTPVRSSFSSPTSTVTSQEGTSMHEAGNQGTFGIKVEQTDISEVNKCLSVFDNSNNTGDQLESTNSLSENQETGSLLPDSSFTNSDQVNVKQEPAIDEEPELEITGIEINPTELKDWAPVNEANAGNLFSDDISEQIDDDDDEEDDWDYLTKKTERKGFKRKHVQQPLGVKYTAIMEYEKGKKSKTQISKMFNIPNTTFTGWLQNADSIKAGFSKFGPTRRTMKQINHTDLEDALLSWFKNARAKNRPLNSHIVTEKAKIIAKQLGIEEFNPSSWLERFKKRNQITFKATSSIKTDSIN